MGRVEPPLSKKGELQMSASSTAVSGLTVKKMFTIISANPKIFAPSGTNATAVAWLDIRDYNVFSVQLIRLTGTGTVVFSLVASDDSSGTNTYTIKTKTQVSGALGPNLATAGSSMVLEALASEIATASAADGIHYRYVSAVVTLGTGSDTLFAVQNLSEPRFAHDALTTDVRVPS
jgi:hypothetical protein